MTAVGIDYSTYEAVVAAIPFGGGKPKVAHARFRPSKASGETAAILALGEISVALDEALNEVGVAPDDTSVFFLERGYGMSRRADWSLGAYFGAIYVALKLRDSWSPVNPMDLREWKEAVTKAAGIGTTKAGRGNGNAKKEVANEATRALLGLVEVDGTDWTADELDAYAIAWTGRRLNARAAEAAA